MLRGWLYKWAIYALNYKIMIKLGMAEIINIEYKKNKRLIDRAIKKGWIEELKIDGHDYLKVSLEGNLALSKAIQLLFWTHKIYKTPEYRDKPIFSSLYNYAKSWLDEFDRQPVLMIITLIPELENLNIYTIEDLEYMVNAIIMAEF